MCKINFFEMIGNTISRNFKLIKTYCFLIIYKNSFWNYVILIFLSSYAPGFRNTQVRLLFYFFFILSSKKIFLFHFIKLSLLELCETHHKTLNSPPETIKKVPYLYKREVPLRYKRSIPLPLDFSMDTNSQYFSDDKRWSEKRTQ